MQKEQINPEEGKEVSTKSEGSIPQELLIKNEPSHDIAVQIGFVTFKTGIPKKTLDGVLKDKKRKILKRCKWDVQGSDQSQNKWQQLFEMVDKARITELYFYDTKMSQILNNISHINFQNLTYLGLECNNITNIESISFLNAVNLRKLDLSNNQISQSKSLKKLLLNSLNYLQICDNPLIQLDVSRIKCNSQKMYFRLMTHPYTKLFQNIIFLAKLEKNVVSFIMSSQFKYYTGENKYGEKHIKLQSHQKIIVQEKNCNTIKRKFVFQKQL